MLRKRIPNERPCRMSTTHRVHVSDSALMHLCLAGLEVYRIRRNPLETYGLLWGNVNNTTLGTDSYEDYRIDHVTVDVGAKRLADEVEPNARGLNIKQGVVNAYWPHLSFLGDFHTHPYDHFRRDRVVREARFTFSEPDRSDVEENSDYWRCVGLKLGLVLTIAQMDNRGWKKPRRMPHRQNAVEWTMDRYRF